MTSEKERKFIGVFAKCSDAQLALQELKAVDFPMHKVSVVARKAERESDIAGIEVKDDASNILQDLTHNSLSGLANSSIDIGLLAIPSIGPIVVAGAEATVIATTIAGGAIGVAAGSLAGALIHLGIPQDQADVYNDLVFKGYYLVIITSIEIEIHFAKKIFNRYSIQNCGIYQPYLSPKSRYKHGVGVFSHYQDVEIALTELNKAGFPMSQVSVITKDNYNLLEVAHDLANYYENKLNIGNLIVFINATDIYMAGARAILESNKIQNFRIYNQSPINLTDSYRQVVPSGT
ncbi:hypothetical protein [Nostoc sp. PA-18-2419]|uniref:hypothetical protein n=1 Tax=Nostoc sp. PA-18-2419 TaxID=2575443 RepID=UPI0011093F2D|nr:hypothetical protein [Nostoc sp. PA-18-2419]